MPTTKNANTIKNKKQKRNTCRRSCTHYKDPVTMSGFGGFQTHENTQYAPILG